jgi:hypothetical protein
MRVCGQLDEGEWSTTCPSRALLPGMDPSTHWTGGWMSLGAGVEKG